MKLQGLTLKIYQETLRRQHPRKKLNVSKVTFSHKRRDKTICFLCATELYLERLDGITKEGVNIVC